MILSENTAYVSKERIDKRGCEKKKKKKNQNINDTHCDTKMSTITRAKVGQKQAGLLRDLNPGPLAP